MNVKKKRIALLGSTGSIGKQTLEVIEKHPDIFEVEVLTANNNAELLIEQARKFLPNHVVIVNKGKYQQVVEALQGYPVKVFAGSDSLNQIVQMESIDLVLTALVGYSGLLPTIKAIEAGKSIALANKETLVVAGELVTRLAAEKNIAILPVDSEHSAIFQCLAGERYNKIEKIFLTASGGPFRGRDINYLQSVTKTEALKHPNWNMGAKVTIDSASMMNKGFETIEARWLFNLQPEQIEVVVHPQSIVHSLVQFEDGAIKAQLGLPDMRLPIQYALGFPQRLKSDFPRFSFMDHPSLTFEKPDTVLFRGLSLSIEALKQGGNKPCALNAANEIVVDAFLKDKIGFLKMAEIIEHILGKVDFIKNPSFEDYAETDAETRKMTLEVI
ncbi:MAG: 1-deoxy-D-xylulose-5-phosphate reductoisomerase [Bacteroidota bacterium]|nr:1-deoxy-D-xylulose-5-phosphate reductoisomerase [Bacteroidota bacterium]MDP4274820.1 1-deoxy-D-xylulose-5-phosphate reductoisomerase [Bacteroidota bacterium]